MDLRLTPVFSLYVVTEVKERRDDLEGVIYWSRKDFTLRLVQWGVPQGHGCPGLFNESYRKFREILDRGLMVKSKWKEY